MKKKERARIRKAVGHRGARSVHHKERRINLLARGPEHMDDDAPKPGDADWTDVLASCGARLEPSPTGKAFLHWEVAFPGVWHKWTNTPSRKAAFDAVIGNPPWDRIKLQEVEWFATRVTPNLALTRPRLLRGAKGIQRLRDVREHLSSPSSTTPRPRADKLSQLVRVSGGDYPLLGGGDVNLYSLFVERAMNLDQTGWLYRPADAVGHLRGQDRGPLSSSPCPSSGRVGGLFDFENKRLGTDLPPFFQGRGFTLRSNFAPSYSAERSDRASTRRECAFFLHDTENDP